MTTRSLKARIQRSFAAAITIPLLVMAVVMVFFYYQSFKNNTLAGNRKTISLLAGMLTRDIKQVENRLVTLSGILDAKLIPGASEPHILENLLQGQAMLVEIRLLDKEGYVQTVAPANEEVSGLDMSGALYFKEASRTRKPVWSRAYLSARFERPAASIAVPFSRGMIVALIDFSSLYEFLEMNSSPDAVKLAVIDQGGTFIAHSDREKATQRIWEFHARPLRRAISESGGQNIVSMTIDEWLVTGSLVSKTGWLIVLYQNQQAIISPLWNLSVLLILTSLFSIAAGLYMALQAASIYFRYFQRLMAKIHDVADGIYSQHLPTEGYQELQEVETDFYKMIQSVKAREEEVFTLNRELKKQLEEKDAAIREREKAEAAIRESHETFMTVLDGIDAGIYAADLSTREILFTNKHLQKRFGTDLTGRYCWEVFRGEDEKCSDCLDLQLLNEKGEPGDVLTWHDHNPETGRWYSNRDRAIKWIDGRLVRLQIATDITEFKVMEEKLHRSQKLESIGTLAGGIAHDFNNILSPVIGYTEMMLQGAREHSLLYSRLHEVLKASFRARDLVRQILMVSRQSSPELKPMKVQHILTEVLNFARSTFPSSIEIRREINPHCGMIMGDPTQIHQIAMNLMINASHAMEEKGGVVTVRLDEVVLEADALPDFQSDSELPPGPCIRLEIADTGTGIDPAIVGKIFDPYYSTKGVDKGSGLGLAVVYGIVNSMNGAVTVDSKPGKGALFSVYLPLLSEKEDTEAPPALVAVPGGKECILLVDDEAAVLEVERLVLEHLGYRVTPCDSPQEALETFRANPHRFDLVITDMTMPGMTGDQLVKAIRSVKPDTPLIICTGYSQKIDGEKAKAMGVGGLLIKPIMRSEMARMVRNVLDDAASDDSATPL